MWWEHFKPANYSLGWPYTPIWKIGHDDLSKSLSVKAIVSSIGLIRPCRNTHLLYHIWTWKVSQNMEIVFSCHLLPWWGLMEISMNFHGFGDYLCSWRLLVLDTTPKNSIFGHLRVKTDQLTWGEGYGRVIDSSEGQGHMSYMETMCFWRSRLVIWPPWLNPLSLSFRSQLYMKQHRICDSLIQTYYISKLNIKIQWEKCWKSRKNSVFSGHR